MEQQPTCFENQLLLLAKRVCECMRTCVVVEMTNVKQFLKLCTSLHPKFNKKWVERYDWGWLLSNKVCIRTCCTGCCCSRRCSREASLQVVKKDSTGSWIVNHFILYRYERQTLARFCDDGPRERPSNHVARTVTLDQEPAIGRGGLFLHLLRYWMAAWSRGYGDFSRGSTVALLRPGPCCWTHVWREAEGPQRSWTLAYSCSTRERLAGSCQAWNLRQALSHDPARRRYVESKYILHYT